MEKELTNQWLKDNLIYNKNKAMWEKNNITTIVIKNIDGTLTKTNYVNATTT